MQTRLYGSGRQPRLLSFKLCTSFTQFRLTTQAASCSLLQTRSHDVGHFCDSTTKLAPRDEICFFAPDIPCGLSLRSHYVFIPVLSIHQRVFLQASELATPRWSPFVLSNYVVLKRSLARINYMIYTNRSGSPMITLHSQYVHVLPWIQPLKCVHPSWSAPLTQKQKKLWILLK
ncbi:hypothetical protein P692DRAFT_20548881 [Suillus brevipes Sb2]|jgi:hypothetical protein|nr:hypothetical protein P692DRAFT_20548881 [Suillus brevipes Sb2]